MENPYHHPYFKPHTVDTNEIRLLVFDIYSIVIASSQMQGDGTIGYDDDDDPDTDEDTSFSPVQMLHFRLAERELSKKFLRLAVLMRTLDDIFLLLDNNHDYSSIREVGDIGTFYDPQNVEFKTVRDACNKIIHANDFRPVYASDDAREHKDARWGMDGSIEIEGTQNNNAWSAAIYVPPFLDHVLEIVNFVDTIDANNTE